MSKKSQEHPYIPALNGEVLRTKHDKLFIFLASSLDEDEFNGVVNRQSIKRL